MLEYGGSDRSVLIQMPAALSIPMNMKAYNWGYLSEPEPYLNGRRMHCPRGKVLGGSSSINGLVYVRGHPLDFERWEEEGAKGWSYRDVLPYFRRAESFAGGADAWRGDGGPLATAQGRKLNPLYEAFIEAGREAGYAVSSDLNGERQEGFGALDMTVRDGVRASTANAYLRPSMKRPNLKVVTHALASRVAFDGRRAVGVHYRRDGLKLKAGARREVILCGGPINSPQLLKLSGVGPAAELGAFGIDVVANRPGVGENLQDHLEFTFQVASKQPITLFSHTGFIRRALIGAEWLLRGKGLGASNHFEAGGFIRSRAGVRYPDIQFHFLPMAVAYDGSTLAREHGFQAHVGPMRSKSRGWVRLKSPDPAEPPHDPVQLYEPCRGLDRDALLRAPDPRNLRSSRLRSLSRPGNPARDEMRQRRSDRRLRARARRQRLSSVLHVQDGIASGPVGRGRSANEGDRRRGSARRRFLDHALDHQRQPQRADDHDRRKGG